MHNQYFNEELIYNVLASKLNKIIQSYQILNIINRPLSSIFRLELVFADNSRMTVYLKKYHPTNNNIYDTIQIESEFKTTKFWYEQFKENEKYGVIKPLYFNPEQRVVISEESKGQNLSKIIFKQVRYFPSPSLIRKIQEMVHRSGEWLYKFQSVQVKEETQKIALDSLLDYVNLRLAKIVENPKIEFDINLQKKINNYINSLWEKVSEQDKQMCYLHSDFSLSNILVQNEKIIVLDFNKMESGSPFHDLSRFYHQLTLLKNKPIYQKKIIDVLTKSFLTGYGDGSIDRNPLFKIYLMQHRINHLGKTARYWEHSRIENLYSRWIVRNTMKEIYKLVSEK